MRGDIDVHEKRPLCVLMIGNGFTISLMRHLGLFERVNTTQLIPIDGAAHPPQYVPFEAPANAPWRELKKDEFRGNLWSPEIWPHLYAEWQQWRTANPTSDQYAFFTHLVGRSAGRARGGVLNFDGDPVGVELRFYLWQLFRYFDLTWRSEVAVVDDPARHRRWGWNFGGLRPGVLDGWDWWAALQLLCKNFQLVIVSFNYDPFIECCLGGITGFWFNPPHALQDLAEQKPRQPVLIKPHGSITWDPFTLFGPPGPHPWLSMGRNSVFAHSDWIPRLCYPRPTAPFLPDLVPPGHAGDHLWDMKSQAQPATRDALQRCDALIVCGLSAVEPDTAEISMYLQSLRPRTYTAHVDVPPRVGAETPIFNLLRERLDPGYYHFFNALEGRADRIPSHLGSAMLL